jgi:hypothetical protein
VSARASAGIVYSLGMTSVGRPYSAAVAAVIGPMEATATRPRQALRSASLNCSAKFRAVDELVNVTASTAPDASASRSRTTPSSTRRVWYAGTSVTAAPEAPELDDEHVAGLLRPRQQHAVAGSDEAAQSVDQPLGAVLGRHHLGADAVLGERVGRRGADRRHPSARDRRPCGAARGEAPVYHGDAVHARKDHPHERLQRGEGRIERFPRRRRLDHDRRRLQHAGAGRFQELGEPLRLGARAGDDDRPTLERPLRGRAAYSRHDFPGCSGAIEEAP